MPTDPAPVTGLKVVVADDLALLRAGLSAILGHAGHTVVAQAADAGELIAMTRAFLPDLIVTDVRMPPEHRDDGLRAAAQLRTEFPGLAVLVLSQYVSDAYLPGLLDAGTGAGVGYLLKDRVGHVRDFLASVATVAAGGVVIDPDVIRQLVGANQKGPLAGLTTRETAVLSAMAEGKTNGAIAAQLYVSEAAVRKHVGAIFAKLGLHPDAPEASDRRVMAVLTFLRHQG